MKRTTFNIRNRPNNRDNLPEFQPVEGYVLNNFPVVPENSVAVHKEPLNKQYWKVTHIPSGQAINGGKTRKAAIEEAISRVIRLPEERVLASIAQAEVINS